MVVNDRNVGINRIDTADYRKRVVNYYLKRIVNNNIVSEPRRMVK